MFTKLAYLVKFSHVYCGIVERVIELRNITSLKVIIVLLVISQRSTK